MESKCLTFDELKQRYQLNDDEIRVIANASGIFVASNDNKICATNTLFLDLVQLYYNLKRDLQESDIVEFDRNDNMVNILVDLGYTVISYKDKVYVTYKYKRIDPNDLRFVVDQKERQLIILLFNKYYLVPNELYNKVQQRKKQEKKRTQTIIIDID